MEQLHEFLQTLLSTASYELHLEPNRKPYVVSSSGETEVSDTPLIGTQISMMVFPLIPPDVKQELPDQPQIEFVHPHNLGKFNFIVRKSPSGFNVTVYPIYGEILRSDVESVPDGDADTDTGDENVNALAEEPDTPSYFDAETIDTNLSQLPVDVSEETAMFEAFSREEFLEQKEITGDYKNSFETFTNQADQPFFSDQDLAFSTSFARTFVADIQNNISQNSSPAMTQNGWTYTTAAAISETAKMLGLMCTFRGDGNGDAVIRTDHASSSPMIVANWEWECDRVFDAGKALDDLRRTCRDEASGGAFLLTFCTDENYADHVQNAGEKWFTAIDDPKKQQSLFLHTIIFEQEGETRKFERLATAKIDADSSTIVSDLPF